MRKSKRRHIICRLIFLAYAACIVLSAVLILDVGHLQWDLRLSARLDMLAKQWSRWENTLRNSYKRLISTMRAQQHLPKAIIIGVRKGGTRALLDFLSLHPAIRTAKYEVHFFDNDSCYHLGLSWYRRQMPYSLHNQIVIEKTPGYFVSLAAPRRVHKVNANMKLLLIVRDPVTRLISDYTQVHYSKLAKGKPHDKLEELAFADNGTRLNYRYKPVRNSLYHVHLKRWLQHFRRSSLHVIDGERFIRDPMWELRRVEEFLHLPKLIPRARIFFNATKGFYCFYDEADEVHCLSENKGRLHVNVSEPVVARLRTLFRDHNERLFRMLQRRFEWH